MRSSTSTNFFVSLLALPLAVAQPTISAGEEPPAVPGDHARKMAASLELFKTQVRQLLVERCFECHGGKHRRGGFDLRTREGLLSGGDSGPAVVPGDAQASLAWRLAARLQEPYMPHKGDALQKEAVERLGRWIELGAAYDRPLSAAKEAQRESAAPTAAIEEGRNWWAFRDLARAPLPAANRAEWCRTPLDRFVLAALEAKGLEPNEPAAPRRLIRRLSFDLSGLPPEPEEVEAFLGDSAPDSCDRLADRLLASPRRGERWARHWLDVARFAESHGFEHDYDRSHAYHFRDFVIRALNQDLPYDQFVRWQVAGDEIAPEEPLALMATGFLGAGVFPTQITLREVERTRYDALDDMLATTGVAFLGLTVGCARCHDHKYDPIPTREYYGLLSSFTTTVRSEVDLDLEPERHREAQAAFEREHAPLAAALEEFERDELPRRFSRWMETRGWKEEPVPVWTEVEIGEARSAGGARIETLDDGSLLVSGSNPDADTFTLVAHTSVRGITAFRLEALAHGSLVKGGPGRAPNGNFALSTLRISAAPDGRPGERIEVKLENPRATFEQNAKNLSVASALDSDKSTGWAVDPQLGKDHAAVFESDAPVGFEGGTRLELTLDFAANKQHALGRLRLAVSNAGASLPLDGPARPEGVERALARLERGEEPSQLSPAEREELRRWHRRVDPERRRRREAVDQHFAREPKPVLMKVMVSSEGLTPMRHHSQGADFFQKTHVLVRGDPDQKLEVAPQGFLSVLNRAPEGARRWQTEPPAGSRTSFRRTALARWLTDVEHGAGQLLARVIVNRLWQHLLGRGLVGTPSDFGFQGERPSHPELLDWLARDLIDGGWSLSRIQRLIVTSSVYQESSRHDPLKAAVDPLHGLWWRRPPRRIEAEAVRDAVFAVSGLLDRRMFGAGTLAEDHDRRSIYYTVKRSQLVPMMQVLDAPEALVSLAERPTTTIAPQALVFMNHPSVRRCARAFAARLAPLAEDSPAAAVRGGYFAALGREPAAEEMEDALRFLEAQTALRAAAGDPEPHTALAGFCQVLLSLNEFIYVP